MLSQTTVIIHSAWAVNFMLGIRSFEDQHIRGVQNLINFSLSVSTPNPARFYFCSSISVALATSSPAIIPESATENLHAALPMGYSRSKLVAEHIVRNAAVQAGAPAHVLRIGQIVGDSKEGLWNDTEAIPLMVRSALTLKALPSLHEVRLSLSTTITRNSNDLPCLHTNASHRPAPGSPSTTLPPLSFPSPSPLPLSPLPHTNSITSPTRTPSPGLTPFSLHSVPPAWNSPPFLSAPGYKNSAKPPPPTT